MIKLLKVKLSRDLSFVFNIMTDSKESSLIARKINIGSFEQFEEWFRRELDRFYTRFYIIQNEKDENVGFIYAYDYSDVDQHAKMGVYVIPKYQNLGIGVEATIRFADELFMEMNLRRIYSYVYEYNTKSLECNRDAGLIQEGCLRENRFHEGRFWDMYIFVLSKEIFYEKYGKTVERLHRHG